ncbi:MAG: PRC-barrel domain-containing protein [Nanoarchaeota archaeon]|nr:PRC-barrel domain-containing protein [Nanoarchaeota archaeon]
MSVYTDDGSFFGIVEESMIADNKISGWKIKSTKGSVLSKMLGGAKGVIVPHQLVKAIDNVMLISKAAIPSIEEDENTEDQ